MEVAKLGNAKMHLAIISCLTIALMCLSLYFLSLRDRPFYSTDFRTFFAAAQILSEQPQNLYDASTQLQYQISLTPLVQDLKLGDKLVPYYNPPFYLLPLRAWVSYNPQTTYELTFIVNFLFLLGNIYLLHKFFLKQLPLEIKFILLCLIISFTPVYFTFLNAQNSLCTLFLYLITYSLLLRKQEFVAGLVSSLLLYKPQFGLLLYAYFLLNKKYAALAGVSTGALILLIISTQLAGDHLLAMLRFILEYTNNEGSSPMQEISLNGLWWQIKTLLPTFPIRSIIFTSSLISIFAGLVLTFLIKKHTLAWQLSLILTYSIIAGGHAHYHEAVLLLFPFAVLVPKFWKSSTFWWVTGITWFILFWGTFMTDTKTTLYFIPNIWLFVILIILLKLTLPTQFHLFQTKIKTK